MTNHANGQRVRDDSKLEKWNHSIRFVRLQWRFKLLEWIGYKKDGNDEKLESSTGTHVALRRLR